jgi:hypothetical protein
MAPGDKRCSSCANHHKTIENMAMELAAMMTDYTLIPVRPCPFCANHREAINAMGLELYCSVCDDTALLNLDGSSLITLLTSGDEQ